MSLFGQLEEIEKIHKFIKLSVFENTERESHVQVLYGGSVNPDNAKQIKSLSCVDGVLVGGASLDTKKFTQICL